MAVTTTPQTGGEAPKADAAHDNFGFMAVEKTDAFRLSRPNRSTIKCNDGEYHDACGVQAIAWDKLLTKAQMTKVEAAIERQAKDPSLGVQVLVKGEYKVYGDFVAFEPTEVWLAQKTDGNTDGTFVRLFDRGIRCITAPCPQYEEGRLNSSRQMNIDGIDFGDTSDSLQEKIYTATTSPETGENSSETAFTDSIVPKTSPCFTCRPISGSSTKTTSPSWRCAKSVMPTDASPPSKRIHS